MNVLCQTTTFSDSCVTTELELSRLSFTVLSITISNRVLVHSSFKLWFLKKKNRCPYEILSISLAYLRNLRTKSQNSINS